MSTNPHPIKTEKQKARKPRYSSLSNSKPGKCGIDIEYWNMTLEDYLKEKKYV